MMKLHHFACKAFIFLVMACTLLCASRPVSVFAQDGRESLEIARQKKMFRELELTSEMLTHAVIVDGLVSQAGESFYRFLLLGGPEDAHRGENIANEAEVRIKHIRGFAINAHQMQPALDELEKAFAGYASEFVRLSQARREFLDQYGNVVVPLNNLLEAKAANLAQAAKSTGDAWLWGEAAGHLMHVNKIRAALVAFSRDGREEDANRVLSCFEAYLAELRAFKETATPEMGAALNEADDTVNRLMDAYRPLVDTGRNVSRYSNEIEHSLDTMKELSGTLTEVLYERRRAGFRALGRDMF